MKSISVLVRPRWPFGRADDMLQLSLSLILTHVLSIQSSLWTSFNLLALCRRTAVAARNRRRPSSLNCIRCFVRRDGNALNFIFFFHSEFNASSLDDVQLPLHIKCHRISCWVFALTRLVVGVWERRECRMRLMTSLCRSYTMLCSMKWLDMMRWKINIIKLSLAFRIENWMQVPLRKFEYLKTVLRLERAKILQDSSENVCRCVTFWAICPTIKWWIPWNNTKCLLTT